MLVVWLLVLATEWPVSAQTIRPVSDGTVLKQIIVFGRHSIRAPTSATNELNVYAADPFPIFVGVPTGYLTPKGRLAAGVMGTYFREYLVHEGVLTSDTNANLARSYFRANSIERSYMTAAHFGAGLIPGASIPVHTFAAGTPDLVFDPLLAGVAKVNPARALAEAQGIYGSGSNLASAYSSEFSLLRKVLYPSGIQPTGNTNQGVTDPTAVPIVLATNAPQYFSNYVTGGVLSIGGVDNSVDASDPFVMQYADGFPTNEVGWGRFTLDTLSQQTRLLTLQFEVLLRQPYLARVQSSSAASHILRSMLQVTGGVPLAGAFGTPESQVLVIISSDAYLTGVAGLLNMHWLLPGYQADFCPPGGALIFELRQEIATQNYLVRVFYTAQTFDQLRQLTPLSLAVPPATMQLLVPGGSSATNLDVPFATFTNLLNAAIDLNCVWQPFAGEPQPTVENPYTADNPTNLTASVSSKTLTIGWSADHLGWTLQTQTNGLGGGQWYDLPGSSVVNMVDIPIQPTSLAVFYRLSQQPSP